MVKRLAALSFDLDDKWTYLRTHGDAAWQALPSYLDIVVPRVLDFLKQRKLKVTFFIVGQDAAFEKNHALLKSISDAGHEIGNHTFHHHPWLQFYSDKEIEKELTMAEESIEKVTGQKLVGFRGPGYSVTCGTLQQLIKRGYQYDATTLPSLIAPLARVYYFLTADFNGEEKRKRKSLGGTFWDGFHPIKPYLWQTSVGKLLEIPVTTMPAVRVPIHLSYLLSLRQLNERLALQYFRVALRLCLATGTQPSLVLHPTDFLDGDDTSDLDFFPAMRLHHSKKQAFTSAVLQLLSEKFRVVTLKQFAQEVVNSARFRL